MPELLQRVAARYVKPSFTNVKSGDTVRVYTTVTEGTKTRTQFFEGLVIRRRGGVGPDASFTVRRIASGVGVERTFALQSPVITEIKILRGAKVRRAQLHYMRERSGKSARLKEQPVRQADRDTAHPWLKGTDEKGQAPLEAPAKTKPAAKPKPESKPKPEAKADANAKPEAKTEKK